MVGEGLGGRRETLSVRKDEAHLWVTDLSAGVTPTLGYFCSPVTLPADPWWDQPSTSHRKHQVCEPPAPPLFLLTVDIKLLWEFNKPIPNARGPLTEEESPCFLAGS